MRVALAGLFHAVARWFSRVALRLEGEPIYQEQIDLPPEVALKALREAAEQRAALGQDGDT